MIRLGEGKDGRVFQTDRLTAIKYLSLFEHYTRELRAYRMLDELKVDSVCGHAVPNLVGWSDSNRAIEMTIVRPPFLLDFVSAYSKNARNRQCHVLTSERSANHTSVPGR